MAMFMDQYIGAPQYIGALKQSSAKSQPSDWSDVTRGDLAHMCVDGAILYDIYLNTI